MPPPRQKTSVRMKEARERLDAFEAQEALAEPAKTQNPAAMLVFWICVVVFGLVIYFVTLWVERH